MGQLPSTAGANATIVRRAIPAEVRANGADYFRSLAEEEPRKALTASFRLQRPPPGSAQGSTQWKMSAAPIIVVARRRARAARRCSARLAAADREDDADRTGVEMMTPATLRSIDRGLAYLSKRQQEERGLGLGRVEPQRGRLHLAGISFVASGSTPDEDLRQGSLAGGRVRARQYRRRRLHPRRRRHRSWPHVWARLCHALLVRNVRHDAPAATCAKADQGREPDRRYAEFRGRLAVPAATA